ncbi:MaoC/PaaZ C-terminal domain-containing protein [Nonomuraea sp. NPDC046570]|uniref:MaoC/PaaZ C-terminal domain-containing protein n=1 Tax=Nonomuraea sp. NPDC046570 TaxID=3155255 RepID=UPI0033FA8969
MIERRIGPLTLADLVRYAGAGGDFNPIHFDGDVAQAAGFPGPFAHGLLTAGILSGVVTELGRLRRYQVRYVAQVWPGDVLVCSAEGSGSADGAYDLTVEREAPDGTREVVLRGSAEVEA